MAKIRYDPNNPDKTLLKQAVFARLKQGWHQVESADFGGESLCKGFEHAIEFTVEPGPWRHRFLSDVYSMLWELVGEGIIRPGQEGHSLNFPFLAITEYGRRVIENQNAHPYEIERFLEQTGNGKPIDGSVETYLAEALRSFRSGLFVASAICLGIAAERVFILIAEAMVDALSSTVDKTELRKRLDQNAMKPKQDWVHDKLKELDKNKRKLAIDLPESAPLLVTGIYDLIRQQRNDLGHPSDDPPEINRDQAEASLLLFARFYGNAERLRTFLLAHQNSL